MSEKKPSILKIDKIGVIMVAISTIVLEAIAGSEVGFALGANNTTATSSGSTGGGHTTIIQLDSKMWGSDKAVFTLHDQPWQPYAGNFSVTYGDSVVIIIYNYDDMVHSFSMPAYNINVDLPSAQDVTYSNGTSTTIPSITVIGPFTATQSAVYGCSVPCEGMVPGEMLDLGMTVIQNT